eukprot:GILJ01004972.1.p1 GENE.GILJ01004972.1~~GILJ01004972.1.p1  ORF type:complete len:820 (-),score=178.34 GILJ01004972.1:195-2654(-)
MFGVGNGYGAGADAYNYSIGQNNYGAQNLGAAYDFNNVQQQIPPSSYMRAAAPSSMGRPLQTSYRMGTAAQAAGDGPRPMTSNRGAGFSTAAGRAAAGKDSFDPFNQAGRGPAPPLQKRSESSPEEMFKEMEKEVNRLLEASAMAKSKNDFAMALEKAKEATKKERLLCKQREQANMSDQINIDLTYSVCFNLAVQYQANEMYTEALNTYSLIVKNKQYPQSGRLRVNMGNIFYQQKKYTNAIKMYRMALDQIPNTGREIRFKIMRNIGNALVRLGQFAEAIQNYENIMDGAPDFKTGFNLILCYFAIGDKEKMKKGFTRVLGIQNMGTDEEEDEEQQNNDSAAPTHTDSLKEDLKERQREAQQFIMNSAKLVAPVVEKDFETGFDWCIESLKAATYTGIASELEISKAIAFLKKKDFDRAIEVLKAFEKKDSSLMARAATNLSFLYFLENDLKNAEKYADIAVRNDRYNAKALVNKGNCLFARDELERAKELYLEAIGVEADCIEAIFNLGLVNKKLSLFNESLQAFEKLQSIVPNNSEVMYQIAHLYDMLDSPRSAAKWFNILISRTPTDPGVLTRMGNLFAKENDETQAFHYHLESYRYYPVNMEAISWLGVWYVKSELYEKAIQFFERASQIQPQEVKWQLMVASCYRRMGSYQQAFKLYQDINKNHPDNIECLRYMVTICKELGLKYEAYATQLKKLERQQEAKQQPRYANMTQQVMAEADEGRGGITSHSPIGNGPTSASPALSMGNMRATPTNGYNNNEKFFDDDDLRRSPSVTDAAPIAVPQKPQRKLVQKQQNDDEDWGEEELGDDLLPL